VEDILSNVIAREEVLAATFYRFSALIDDNFEVNEDAICGDNVEDTRIYGNAAVAAIVKLVRFDDSTEYYVR